uniref:CSON012715 protein n=1 Tax=Culicoides sonorensis TaxID=179676 RepID=A0A336KKH7_CULSO
MQEKCNLTFQIPLIRFFPDIICCQHQMIIMNPHNWNTRMRIILVTFFKGINCPLSK